MNITKKNIFILIIIFPLFAIADSDNKKKELSNKEVKKILIQRSISIYPGNCPCPYNRDRAGRRCGKRSAWSRIGGYTPLCYPSDITPEMIKQYRKNILEDKKDH